jgi:hypothetical protein
MDFVPLAFQGCGQLRDVSGHAADGDRVQRFPGKHRNTHDFNYPKGSVIYVATRHSLANGGNMPYLIHRQARGSVTYRFPDMVRPMSGWKSL